MTPAELPPPIVSVLEPDEPVEAVFGMSEGLTIYATDRRLLSKRGDLVVGVVYRDITHLRRRAPLGLVRIVIGITFFGAGAVTGFESAAATTTALLLFLLGGVFLLLGTFGRRAWVELGVQQQEPRPSLAHIAMFLPFWILLRSGKRYKIVGRPGHVDALFEFLKERTPPPPVTGSRDSR
jgi:hypothetical protein